MWNVIIVDDEPLIREGIRELVDWEALGMRVAAEAEDGEEALEKALACRADIALVDLNMPIMDGITLIGELRNRLPSCRIVIVTGHDEFAYAQQAIHHGVDEYLLKPANPKDLTAVLTRIGEQLEKAREQEKHLEMASRQIRKNIPLLRERFCNEWIGESLTRQEVLEQLRFLELPDRAPSLFGIVRWPEAEGNAAAVVVRPERERQLMLFAIENIMDELLSPWPHARFRDPHGFLCAIVWDAADADPFGAVERAVARYLKLFVVTHAEPVTGGVETVPAVYRKARGIIYRETAISPVVRRARTYMRDHHHDPDLSLESTARAVGVSPVYLSRLFRQELGTTFVSLLTQIRISRATRLLLTTSMSVAEIAEAVGYESQHYFSTAFKKAVGVSPIRYRKGDAVDDEGGG